MIIFLLLSAVVMLAASAALLMALAERIGDKGYYSVSVVLTLFSAIAGFGIVALVIVSIVIGVMIHASGYKAEILNKEFGTSYTGAELFWAGDFITEIHRSRIDKEEKHGE